MNRRDGKWTEAMGNELKQIKNAPEQLKSGKNYLEPLENGSKGPRIGTKVVLM